MKTRATSMILTAILLGSAVPTGAQDAGVEEVPAEEGPTAGVHPFEDPTIEPPRDENLKIDESAEAAAGVTGVEAGDAESDSGQPDESAGSGPVEDPTLHHDKAEATEEASKDGSPKPSEDSPPKKDEGPNVKVAYDRGFLLSIDNWFFLALSGLVQARYTVNYRTKPPTDPDTMVRDKQITQGFEVPREATAFWISIGSSSGSISFATKWRLVFQRMNKPLILVWGLLPRSF